MLTLLVVLCFMSWYVMKGGFRLENTMKDCYSKHPLPERFPLRIHTDTLDFSTSSSLRKQTSFCVATNGFPAKWRLRNKSRNSILMTHHCQKLGTATDWSCHLWNFLQLIRTSTQIWVVTCHQHEISVLVSQTSFHGEIVSGAAECHLFSQATLAVQLG